MSEKQKIKVSIADRVYPLSIAASQEEGLRQAANSVQQMVKEFEKSYAVSDKQDVLAMCALQYAAQLENQLEKNTRGDDPSIKTDELIELIDLHLSNY